MIESLGAKMILHVAVVALLTKTTSATRTLSKIELFATNAVGLRLLMSPGTGPQRVVVKSRRGRYILYGIS